MAMDYDSALITGAQLVDFTGAQDLANLETDGELDLDTLVLEGHRFVFRWIEQAGVDPTLLTNETRLESAVAYATLVRLALAGYIDPLDDRAASVELYREQLMDELKAYKPESAEADLPRHANEGIPMVGNFEPGWAYGSTTTRPSTQRYWNDLPDRR